MNADTKIDYYWNVFFSGDNIITNAIIMKISHDVYIEYIFGPITKSIVINYAGKNIKYNLYSYNKKYADGSAYPSLKGEFLVYDITDRNSFNDIKEKIFHSVENRPKILIGAKAELENQRQVSYEEAEESVYVLGIPYIEVSAETGQNIDFMLKVMANYIALKDYKNNDHANFDMLDTSGETFTHILNPVDMLRWQKERVENNCCLM